MSAAVTDLDVYEYIGHNSKENSKFEVIKKVPPELFDFSA